MARVWQLLVKARGDSHHAKKSLTDLKRATRGLNKAIGIDFRGIARNGALALGAGLAVSVRTGVQELRESQKVAAQVSAAWKQNGKNAGVTRGEIDRLSTSLAYKAGIDDELVATAQAQTLAFRNVRNEAGRGNQMFTRLTRFAVDYSAATGKDLVQSQVKFAKALNQPEKAAKLLRGVGVTLTAQQDKQIKKMTEAGNVAGAQKIIMGELEKRYRGAAAAVGQTKPLERFKETFANLTATIVGGTGKGFGGLVNSISAAMLRLDLFLQSAKGAKVLEQIRGYAQQLGAGLMNVGRVAVQVGQALYRWRAVLLPLAAGIGAVMMALKVYRIVTAASIAFKALAIAMYMNPVGAIVLGLIALGAALVVAYKRSATFRGIVQKVAGVMKTAWGFIKQHKIALLALMGPIGIAGIALIKLKQKFGTVGNAIEAVRGAIRNVIGWFQDLPAKIRSSAASMVTATKNFGGDIIDGMVQGIKAGAGKIKSALLDIAKDALRAAKKKLGIASPSRVFRDEVGAPITHGIAEGLRRGARSVTDRAARLADDVRTAAQPTGTGAIVRPRGGVLTTASSSSTPGVQQTGRMARTQRADRVQIIVNAGPGMSEELIARKVIRKLRTTGLTT